ncbi:MAG: hypothetical protein U5N56_12575 [Candidatus Marinimicrobia bacterium]|nr:hypothetical protein [Candidatus Neomarinimicrobiota bacterium]
MAVRGVFLEEMANSLTAPTAINILSVTPMKAIRWHLWTALYFKAIRTVVEGMIIAAFAIGASEGYIYCRAEYPLAISRLEKTIADATEYGTAGKTF